MTLTDLTALVAGIGIAAGLLFGGHYAFQPPRPRLSPPWTYVYGVMACLLGLAFVCVLTGDWTVPYISVAAIFALSGAPVILFYRLDRGIERDHELIDKDTEIDLLHQQLDELGGR